MRVVTLKLRNRTAAQKRISESKARFNLACWGRQSGKTTFGIDKMVWKPLTGRKNGIYWDVLQTYSAAEIAFERMNRLLHNTGLTRRKPHESDLCVFLQNGANVFFKSGDKPQNLRAETLDGAIIDECRQQDKVIWTQVIFPMLGRYNGWCDFYTTPNGFDWFYDLWEKAVSVNTDNEWATFHAPSTECWWWDQAQINQAKASMSEAEYAQEILAEFRDLVSGKAYLNHGPWNQRETSPFVSINALGNNSPNSQLSPHLPILVCMDFNVTPMSWTLGQFRNGSFYFFDEIRLSNSNTQEAAQELLARIEKWSPKHKPGITLIGDATGKANKTSAAGQTDYSILSQALKDAGISFENVTPESNPPVKDRVNFVNAKLKGADGNPRLFYNPKLCPHLKKDFERVVWKPGASAILDQKTDPSLTHASDGVGYAVSVYSEQWRPSPGLLRVIHR